MTELSVALSMLTLVPGGMGGSETYARALTRHLNGVEDVSAIAVVPAGAAGFSEAIPERVVTQVRGGSSTRDRLVTVATATLQARTIRLQTADSDVVHFPFTVPVPRPDRHQGFVQSLHDVQHLDLPRLFSRSELAYRRHFYQGAAKRADVVITISEFAKGRIVELLGIPEERIRVAYLGVDTTAFVPNFGERESFVLYPARGWAHKNHARLVEAMAVVRTSIPGIRLVLTGASLDALGPLPAWVDRPGLVSAEKLRSLYRSAAAIAFPSLYEGFGLPPLEAMASGCPAAVSTAGSLPEVCGGAAILFDPLDVGAIAAGIEIAIANRASLSEAGVIHAARFTWEACRDVHLSAYSQALQSV